MNWEANFIIFLQKASNSFLDALMIGLTYLGDELFFLAFVCVLFWCVNKRVAFHFANVYLLGATAIEGLKAAFLRPRPFIKYKDIIHSIGAETSGYSFPSGHTNSIASLSTLSYLEMSKTKYAKNVLITGITLTAVVMFTRMYLGQHYLTDVIAGLGVGIGLTFALNLAFNALKERDKYIFIAVVPLCAIILIIIFATNSAAANVNAVKLLAGYSAFTAGYYIEQHYIKYNVKSDKFYKQIIKILIGFAGVMLIKEGFKLFLPESNIFLYDFLRYFLMAAWASLGAVYTFKLLKL